jgi:S-adenosylmethionine hydrolase
VAAWLSKAHQFNAFGDEITDIVKLSIPKPKVDGTAIKGVVLKVDNFGNLITNIAPEDAPVLVAADGKFKIRVGKGEINRVVNSFAAGGSGEMFGIIGSSGSLEICTNKGSAARALAANRGSEVVVELG